MVADLDGDGVPEAVTGEVDVLGRPWDAAAFAADPWTPASFAASPWAALTKVVGSRRRAATAPGPRVAWEARHWGAADWVAGRLGCADVGGAALGRAALGVVRMAVTANAVTRCRPPPGC